VKPPHLEPRRTIWTRTGLEKQYKCLVVDPPWAVKKTGRRSCRPNQGVALDYPTVSKADLLSLPVASWAAPQSFIWVWATVGRDRTGEIIMRSALDLLEAWDFRYYTTITWNKKTGVCPFGPYQIVTEHLLFGFRGKADFPAGSLGKLQTFVTESATLHSAKPDSVYQSIAALFPGPRLDVFARQRRNGFDAWGNEVGRLRVDIRRPRSLGSKTVGNS